MEGRGRGEEVMDESETGDRKSGGRLCVMNGVVRIRFRCDRGDVGGWRRSS